MRPNITFVIDELEVGGSQRQLYLLATGLAARGWSIQTLCLQPVLAMAADFAAAGVPVHLLRKRNALDLGLFAALCRFFFRERVAVVHAFSSTAEFFGGLAARACGRRFVASIRNCNERLPRSHRLAKRLACRLADAVVANSHAGAAAATEAGIAAAKKTRVIPNGVEFPASTLSKKDARRQLGVVEDALVVLSVGRLVREKGYDATLELAARMRRQCPRILFLIVGAGPAGAGLARQIDARGLDGQVRLLGERRDVARLLAAADAYLNTSISEGLSNSILEAMAAGVAVIATAVGGTPELVEDGKTGLLCAPGALDDAESNLVRVLSDAALREALGAQARRIVRERYGVENMVSQVEQLYLNLLEPRMGGGIIAGSSAPC